MDTSKYKKLFLQEAYEKIQIINASILNLEKGVDADSHIDSLFRLFHSIKGMSASMGYEPVKLLAHKLEGLLDGLRKKTLIINQPVIDTMLKGADMLSLCLKNVSEDKPLDMDLTALLDEINAHIEGGAAPQIIKTKEPLLEPLPKAVLSNIIKVEAEVFDNAVANIGELLRVKSQISEMTKGIPDMELADSIRYLDGSIKELHETVFHARMMPLEDLVQSLPRIVHDISRNKGKEVEFSIRGADIKVDRGILDAVADPLVHIIRNAIDHGIEMPEERKQIGKSQKGRIEVKAAREPNHIIIEIIDDGRGIDPEKVKEKASALGIVREKIEGMSANEILSLICMPGLSLAKEVTEVSGRGVGMDVVKRNIEAIGGGMSIESEVNKGTRFILKLPLTTSIIKVFMISLNNRLFYLPLSKVESTAEIQMSEIKKIESVISFLYRDTEIPIFDLRKMLNMPFKELKDVLTIVIINVRGKTIGLLVDEFKGVADAYIKPLPKILQDMRAVSGFTIMGDGSPVFLIDAANII